MLKQRIITALLLAPVAFWGLFWLEGQAFAGFVALIIGVAAWEWAHLSGLQKPGQILFPAVVLLILLITWLQPQLLHPLLWLSLAWWLLALLLVVTYPATARYWRHLRHRMLMGLMVLIPTWAGFVLLREQGWFPLLYLLLICWLADIFAYFAGRAFGRHKLAPAVSPGKSWEGVVGGLIGTSLLAILTSFWLNFSLPQGLLLWLLTLLITAVSVLGDLTESLLKREAGMKDSSQLLPGHGGFMDRIDSLTSAAPLFALALALLPGVRL